MERKSWNVQFHELAKHVKQKISAGLAGAAATQKGPHTSVGEGCSCSLLSPSLETFIHDLLLLLLKLLPGVGVQNFPS